MAFVATNLTSGLNDTAGTTHTTASITPTANALVLLSFSARNGASTTPTISAVSGNGLTWNLVKALEYDTSDPSRRSVILYRGSAPNPTAGTITITTGESDTSVWTVDQITGSNIDGNIVQTATNKDESGVGNTLTVTLGAFSTTTNGTFGAFAIAGNPLVPVAGTGFTIVGSSGSDTNNTKVISEWNPLNDTTVDLDFTAVEQKGGIAVEIKALTNFMNILGTGT